MAVPLRADFDAIGVRCWARKSKDGLIVPPNITLIALPAKCPELNPQENIWQFMRENWLSNGRQIVQRHRRPLLRCMEQGHRPAMAHHVDRYPRLGLPVVIRESWYKMFPPNTAF